MPKERGKYKQYLTRNGPIPSRTIWCYKQQTKSTQATPIQIESSKIRSDQIETTSNRSTYQFNRRIIDSSDASPNPLEVISQTETGMNNQKQLDQDDLHDILQDENITKEELAAAYLTAFYQCGPTQRTLTNFSQLHNISSPLKLPTSFSCLTNIIDKSFEDLSYIKFWYCGTCIKIFYQLKNRFQRECGEIVEVTREKNEKKNCTTKYVHFIII